MDHGGENSVECFSAEGGFVVEDGERDYEGGLFGEGWVPVAVEVLLGWRFLGSFFMFLSCFFVGWEISVVGLWGGLL